MAKETVFSARAVAKMAGVSVGKVIADCERGTVDVDRFATWGQSFEIPASSARAYVRTVKAWRKANEKRRALRTALKKAQAMR